MKRDPRKEPKPQFAWGYYNWGTLWGISRTRKGAVQAIERNIGKPWAEAKKSCKVHKVIVYTEAAAMAAFAEGPETSDERRE